MRRLHGAARDASAQRRTGRAVQVNRGMLAGALASKCLERHPEAISFHWRHRLAGLDAVTGVAQFAVEPPGEGEEGAPREVEVSFDLLVGADGANSATRRLLEREDPDLQVR